MPGNVLVSQMVDKNFIHHICHLRLKPQAKNVKINSYGAEQQKH